MGWLGGGRSSGRGAAEHCVCWRVHGVEWWSVSLWCRCDGAGGRGAGFMGRSACARQMAAVCLLMLVHGPGACQGCQMPLGCAQWPWESSERRDQEAGLCVRHRAPPPVPPPHRSGCAAAHVDPSALFFTNFEGIVALSQQANQTRGQAGPALAQHVGAGSPGRWTGRGACFAEAESQVGFFGWASAGPRAAMGWASREAGAQPPAKWVGWREGRGSQNASKRGGSVSHAHTLAPGRKKMAAGAPRAARYCLPPPCLGLGCSASAAAAASTSASAV